LKKTLATVACALTLVVSLSVLPNTAKIGPFGVDLVSAASETTSAPASGTSTTKNSTSSGTIAGTVKLGSKGNNVRILQSFFNKNGYNLKVDGDFGKLTLDALKDYQTKNGLAADGIVGPITRAKINEVIIATTPAPVVTLKLGSKGDAVKTLQTKLNENGYKLTADGIFGKKTLDAVKSYQKANGLAVDGIAGPNTLAKLTPAPVVTPPVVTPPVVTPPVDVVTAASVTDNAAVFEKTIGKEGTWIIATTKDLTFDHAIVLDGQFLNGKTDATTKLKLIQRKIGLYTQDDKRNVTARFTLTAPKLTILSPKASVEHGTFKGDLYVSAPDFKLVDTKVDGNVYFTNKSAEATFKMDAASSITGKKELQLLPETVDAYASASIVTDNTAFEKAISSQGKWIIAMLNNLTFDKEIVLDGDLKKAATDAAPQRKLAVYAHDVKDSKITTGRFTLTAPKLTIKSANANITKGTFKGDVYVTVPNFKLVDAIIDGNVYFTTQEAKDTFKPDATSKITGVQELKLN
jgi:peptidoglycan hydrolase-like protein with peptidoglycan-binding domain